MNIIGHRRIFYALSGLLFLASAAAIAFWGLHLGIDFTGGSLVEVEFSGARPSVDTLTQSLAPLNLGEVRLQPAGERGLLIRLRHIDEPTHRAILQALANAAGGRAGR